MNNSRGKILLQEWENKAKVVENRKKARNTVFKIFVLIIFCLFGLIWLNNSRYYLIDKFGLPTKAYVVSAKNLNYLQDTGLAYTTIRIGIVVYEYKVKDEIYKFEKEIKQSEFDNFEYNPFAGHDSITIKYIAKLPKIHVLKRTE